MKSLMWFALVNVKDQRLGATLSSRFLLKTKQCMTRCWHWDTVVWFWKRVFLKFRVFKKIFVECFMLEEHSCLRRKNHLFVSINRLSVKLQCQTNEFCSWRVPLNNISRYFYDIWTTSCLLSYQPTSPPIFTEWNSLDLQFESVEFVCLFYALYLNLMQRVTNKIWNK